VYGKPAQVLIDRAKKGEVKLGGCCIKDKRMHCKNCNH